MGQLGMGVMINMLGGNGETVDAIKSSLGKTITSVTLEDKYDHTLALAFEDGTTLRLWDDGQSCCEARYMVVEADLPYFAGAKLVDVDIREVAEQPHGEYGEHEVQVLVVTTDKGVIDAVTHNEHNGYYGGFYIRAKLGEAK